jgi:hypothetical protein
MVMTVSRRAALGTTVAILAASSALTAAEQTSMPPGAFLCKNIELTVEHAKIVRQPTTAGLRDFVEGRVQDGNCRVVKGDVPVSVVDVDTRGFALVEFADSGRWWTDAENVWGYFDAPAKVKAWKKS